MSNVSIKLEEAKGAIAFSNFHSDSLLEIALTDSCTLNEIALLRVKQERNNIRNRCFTIKR